MVWHAVLFKDLQDCWRCDYCKAKIGNEQQTVHHCLQNHPDQKVSILSPYADEHAGRTKYRAVHFNISGADVSVSPLKVSVCNSSGHVTMACPEGSVLTSPPHTLQKTSTYMKHTSQRS